MRSEYILGLHKNSLGGSLACALIVAVELWMAADCPLRKWLLGISLALIGGGLLMSLSRGGWLGAVAGLSMIFLLRRDFRLLLRIGLLLIPVIVVLWASLPEGSREYVTSFEAKGQNNIQTRLDDYALARHYFDTSPIYGIGVQLRKQSDATNVVLFTLAETGVLGLITFGLLYAAFFRAVWQMRSKVLPTDPLFSLYAVGSALLVARLAHGMVDHYWGRGPTFMAWAAFGMFVAVFTAVRQREYAGTQYTGTPGTIYV
jgi:putative inorganic carbon (HCO3(-)) transporter